MSREIWEIWPYGRDKPHIRYVGMGWSVTFQGQVFTYFNNLNGFRVVCGIAKTWARLGAVFHPTDYFISEVIRGLR